MHELAITDGIVAGVCERVPDARIRKITLEIGALTAVLPDAVRFCFDVCAAGTRCEGAELEIVPVRGRALCRACGADVELVDQASVCPCGAAGLQILAGTQLLVRSVEVE